MYNNLKYEKKYDKLNTELKKNNIEKFDFLVIQIYVSDLNLGYIVENIEEITDKGTIVKYKPYDHSIREYIEKINKLIDEFNSNYNKNIQHLEITFK